MDTLTLDLTFALRLLRRSAMSSISIVVTLAIGMGAATAMFAVVNGVLLRPLPIRDQSRVVVLRKEQLAGNEAIVPFSVGDLRAFAAQTRTLEAVAGAQYDGAWPATMRDGDRVLSPTTTVVSGDLFRTLGMRPVVGRLLDVSDDVVGGTASVISYAFWRREFGGDSAVIGRVLRLASSGQSFRIVGVVERGFAFPGRAEMWVPVLTVIPGAASNEGQWPFNIVGRLRRGVTPDQARSELATFLANKTYQPGEPRDVRATVRSIESLIVGDARPTLLMLAAGVALLFVIGNVNIANLFIVRGIARQREFAVRQAIGAGRWRIGRQLVTEAAVLATLGGAAGVAIAVWVVRSLVAFAPIELPRLDTIRLDPSALVAAAAMVTLSVLAFGVWPAVASSRQGDLSRALRSSVRAGFQGRSDRSGSLLVIAQLALAVVVVVGAGLLGRTLSALNGLKMGFATPELSTIELSLPGSIATSRPRLSAFYGSMTERLERLPGVSSATVVLLPPFSGGNGWDAFYTAEGQTSTDAAANPALDLQAVQPTYFSTLGIDVRGRSFNSSDRKGSIPVAIVSQSLAQRAWPGQNAIGKRFKLGHADSPSPWTTVVGVAADVRYRELTNPRPVVYVAWEQAENIPPLTVVVVRGRPGHSLNIRDVRRLMSEVEPGVLVTAVRTMRERLTASLARPRFSALVLGAFAVIALVLAAVGVYGVVAALVRQRTQEIGIRIALGAQTADIRLMVLRRGISLATAGIVVGLTISAMSTRLLSAELYGVSPTDPLTAGAAAAILMAMAALACWVPARAAISVDPLIAMKAE